MARGVLRVWKASLLRMDKVPRSASERVLQRCVSARDRRIIGRTACGHALGGLRGACPAVSANARRRRPDFRPRWGNLDLCRGHGRHRSVSRPGRSRYRPRKRDRRGARLGDVPEAPRRTGAIQHCFGASAPGPRFRAAARLHGRSSCRRSLESHARKARRNERTQLPAALSGIDGRDAGARGGEDACRSSPATACEQPIANQAHIQTLRLWFGRNDASKFCSSDSDHSTRLSCPVCQGSVLRSNPSRWSPAMPYRCPADVRFGSKLRRTQSEHISSG